MKDRTELFVNHQQATLRVFGIFVHEARWIEACVVALVDGPCSAILRVGQDIAVKEALSRLRYEFVRKYGPSSVSADRATFLVPSWAYQELLYPLEGFPDA